MRESKFGRALVLETYAKSGGYILGFRVDPQDRISDVYKEIHSLFQIYSVGPIFGVDFTLESEAPNLEQLLVPKVNEDTELIDDQEDSQAIAVRNRTPSCCVSVTFPLLMKINWLYFVCFSLLHRHITRPARR